jgi:transcriptional regulator with XRE-family HTH domain
LILLKETYLLGIGSRIRAHRESLGYTREQFAELLSITPRFCADIELGVKGMSVPTLMRICLKLRVPADYILFGAEKSADTDPVMLMLQTCEPTLRPRLEMVVKAFLLAVNDKKDD